MPINIPVYNFTDDLDALQGYILGTDLTGNGYFIDAGPAARHTILTTQEKIITRILNQHENDIALTLDIVNGFSGRFDFVIGRNFEGADEAAFNEIGSNLIQAIKLLKDKVGSIEEGFLDTSGIDALIAAHNIAVDSHQDIRDLILNETDIIELITNNFANVVDDSVIITLIQENTLSQSDIEDLIATHNTDDASHADIRALIPDDAHIIDLIKDNVEECVHECISDEAINQLIGEAINNLDASGLIGAHNVADNSHEDIRALILSGSDIVELITNNFSDILNQTNINELLDIIQNNFENIFNEENFTELITQYFSNILEENKVELLEFIHNNYGDVIDEALIIQLIEDNSISESAVEALIAAHNEATDSHTDIRGLISDNSTAISDLETENEELKGTIEELTEKIEALEEEVADCKCKVCTYGGNQVNQGFIPSNIVPVVDETAALSINTVQFGGKITWSPTLVDGSEFDELTVYTASIQLMPKFGYTLDGVDGSIFYIDAPNTSLSYNSSTKVITIIFGATGPRTNIIESNTDTWEMFYTYPGVPPAVDVAIPLENFVGWNGTQTISEDWIYQAENRNKIQLWANQPYRDITDIQLTYVDELAERVPFDDGREPIGSGSNRLWYWWFDGSTGPNGSIWIYGGTASYPIPMKLVKTA